MPGIKQSSYETHKIQTLPKWNGITLDIAPRDFIKEINKVTVLKEWTNQYQIKDLFSPQIQDHNNYGWKQLWKELKKKNNITSFKRNHKRSFWIKLMHNELPTLDKLAIRNPSLYKDFKKCVIYFKENKNRKHLFCCTGFMDMINQA